MKADLEDMNTVNSERVSRLKAYANAVNKKKQQEKQEERVKQYAEKINEKEND